MFEDQQKFSERRLFIGVVAAMVLTLDFVTPGSLKADETSEQIQGIVVEEAVAAPGKVGGNSRLKFKITNLSTNSVKLMEVHTAISNDVRLEMKIHDTSHEHVSGLVIKPEETIDLASPHIRVHLKGLNQELKTGQEVSFDLKFQGFSTTAVADVH